MYTIYYQILAVNNAGYGVAGYLESVTIKEAKDVSMIII